MQRDRKLHRSKRSKGFTLFEMVVVICSIVILYMIAAQRLRELPAAAERASFYAVLGQVRTGVNFAMITKLAAGRFNELMDLAGTNPMEFLLEPPRNYRGELEQVTDQNVQQRGGWYFETSTGELVYVIGGGSIEDVYVTLAGMAVNLGQIRLKLVNVYKDSEEGSVFADESDSEVGDWEGFLLQPVNPYVW